MLIVLQVVFPPKTFEASKPELAATIDMTAAANNAAVDTDQLSPDAEKHVVNRPLDDDSASNDERTVEVTNSNDDRDSGSEADSWPGEMTI